MLVNLIGGTIIFTAKGDLSITDALSQFGKLAIGDGLVSSVPSLLISLATGVIVTRSEDNSTFGTDIASDALRNPQLFKVVGVILMVLALVPGFPKIPFIVLSLAMFAANVLVKQKEEQRIKERIKEEQTLALQRKKEEQEEDDDVASFQVEPLSIEIGYGLIPLVDSTIDNSLMNRISAIRRQTAHELGILVSPVRIRDNLYLNANDYSIKIRGNEVGHGDIYPDKYMIISQSDDGSFPFQGIPTKEPAFQLDALWIDEKDKENADLQGFTVIEPLTVIATHLKEIIHAHAPELLGRQEVQKLLEGIKANNNVVIDELIPDIMRLGEVEKVLQNLLEENVPINDLATILETLADYGTVTKDTEVLTEYVRQGLRRTIANKYADENDRINVVTIHPKVEEMVSQSIQKTATGSGAGSRSSRLGNSTFGSDGSSSSSTSTTAYLERKAKEDARDHAQEKREEQARLHQETGGRMVGVRYYEWDSIPKGNRVVKCSYCGAENLISERYKPNRYTCYFCREILE